LGCFGCYQNKCGVYICPHSAEVWHGEELKDPEEVSGVKETLTWDSIFCLVTERERLGPLDSGKGYWASPGQYDIGKCLSRGEEGKDDPVHHPFHLRGQKAALTGA
jgi:hypothetical protein